MEVNEDTITPPDPAANATKVKPPVASNKRRSRAGRAEHDPTTTTVPRKEGTTAARDMATTPQDDVTGFGLAMSYEYGPDDDAGLDTNDPEQLALARPTATTFKDQEAAGGPTMKGMSVEPEDGMDLDWNELEQACGGPTPTRPDTAGLGATCDYVSDDDVDMNWNTLEEKAFASSAAVWQWSATMDPATTLTWI